MASSYQEEPSLDLDMIPDVKRLLDNEIQDVDYKAHWLYKGVLIVEVEIEQRVRRQNIFCKAPHRFMVIGQDTRSGKLVTAYCVNRLITYNHGLEKLAGKSKAILQEDMSWLDGLNLKWKLAAKGSAKYHKPALFACRKDLVAKLCKIFSIKNKEGAKWADVDWDELKRVIDRHEKFTNLEKGLAVNPPPGSHLDTHGRLQQKVNPRPALSATETTRASPVLHQQLGTPERHVSRMTVSSGRNSCFPS